MGVWVYTSSSLLENFYLPWLWISQKCGFLYMIVFIARLENQLKTLKDMLTRTVQIDNPSLRRLEDVLKMSLQEFQDVLKTSWRCLESALKTSWRIHLNYASWIYLTKRIYSSWRCHLKMKTKEAFKKSLRPLHPDECLVGLKQI